MGKSSADDALPQRINKAQRKADQAEAAEREQHAWEGFSVGGRPGRETGGTWGTGDRDRDH